MKTRNREQELELEPRLKLWCHPKQPNALPWVWFLMASLVSLLGISPFPAAHSVSPSGEQLVSLTVPILKSALEVRSPCPGGL